MEKLPQSGGNKQNLADYPAFIHGVLVLHQIGIPLGGELQGAVHLCNAHNAVGVQSTVQGGVGGEEGYHIPHLQGGSICLLNQQHGICGDFRLHAAGQHPQDAEPHHLWNLSGGSEYHRQQHKDGHGNQADGCNIDE